MEEKWCPMCGPDCNDPHCERDGCAWWMDGRCAIVAIAENLKKLDTKKG